MKRSHQRSVLVREALGILSVRIAAGRRERGWTQAELAERLGVSPVTARAVERGEPSVAIGTVFEAARLTGVVLFDVDADRRATLAARAHDRLALLPSRIRPTAPVDDDF